MVACAYPCARVGRAATVVKPAILTVDDDPAVLQAITRDLRNRFGEDYQIARASSGPDALKLLGEFATRDRPVALIASDQRMPEMNGVDFLQLSKEQAPDAKLVLLTAYADTDVAIKAINDIGLDHYLLKPWDPPKERLYPVLEDLLSAWHEEHPEITSEIRVVGHRWSDRSHEIKTFLARNHIPYRWLDVERDEEALRQLENVPTGTSELPVVLFPDHDPLLSPSILDLAAALGLRTSAEQPLYDLCIVGSGPAGLAAAVYAASEGLQTIVVEREAPGGQAGQSASIENYLGFPKGLSGADLTQRAVAQARRFGAEMVVARDVAGFEARGPVRAVRFGDGTEIEARTMLIATGVSYRRHDAPGLDGYAGRGVYYGASAGEARSCEGEDVYIVGAANSAGQAALNIAHFARQVVVLVRGASLEEGMSSYLVERIMTTKNIDVRVQTEVVEGGGDGHLEWITLADRATGTTEQVATNWLFIFIGASPRTDWLGEVVLRDERGFVVTGNDVLGRKSSPRWPLARPPFVLETSVPGVFAAGDVRLDSMKRVASAVGEGAMSVYFVHRYLATI
jgi:thioredoxin reductase (NADPH)